MGNDQDGELLLEFSEQLLDLASGDRVERRGRFIEQQDLGAQGNGTRYAQALLLAARQAQAVALELVFHFLPERSLAQRDFDALVHQLPGQ